VSGPDGRLTPEEWEAQRLLNRLTDIKPLLIGSKRAGALRILEQAKKARLMKGWQDDAASIIDRHDAEVAGNRQRNGWTTPASLRPADEE
jgi:hypothetical protein